MGFRATPHFAKSLAKLTTKNSALTKRINQTLRRFENNKNHPSLRLHKLSGKKRWSISVNQSIRITLEDLDKTEIVLVDIGTHEDVY